MHYLLFYEAGEDYIQRRGAYREDHLRKAWAAVDRGELIMGGAFANPPDGAMFLFQAETPAVVEEFAKTDPYVTNGVVKRWYIREWTTVTGAHATNPIRPGA